MKASELIGSQVLALGTATMCGTVCGIVPSPDLKKIKALEVFMSDDDDCEKKYLEIGKIAAVGGDVVTIKYADTLVMCYPAEVCSPINTPAYSEKGENYGYVTDIGFDEKFNVTGFYVGVREFTAADILTRSDALIVFRLPGSKTKLVKPKKKIPAPPAPQPEAQASTVRITELRRYSFLLGRRLSATVTDLDGEPVATIGELVTDELIERARKRGAIVRLVESSLPKTANV